VYTLRTHVRCRPPKCLTCPCFLRGQTPCIGIITVLSNLQPFDVEGRQKLTVSAWLDGKSLLKPEIFQNRWRTDKDPTKHLLTYAAVTKQPLSASVQAAGEAPAVLQQDLEAQFARDMDALNSLDPIAKQHALKQLKPVLNKFSTVAARFVLDSKIMKTNQGRGAGRSGSQASIIAKKTPQHVPAARPMYPVEGSGSSAIACAKGYGVGAPVSARSRPGNNRHIENKWTCPVCKTGVKDCSQSIKQHKNSQSHLELVAQLHFCETCNVYCENTQEAIALHNASYEHGLQRRLDADMQRDGNVLAAKRRTENDGGLKQPVKKRKQ
jgi:hypothetical protein